MKCLRILVLMHEDLVPPDPLNGQDVGGAEWKTEYDVVSTLREVGHDVKPLGIKSDLQGSGTYSQTFDKAGTFTYTCTPHPNMTGTIIVEE